MRAISSVFMLAALTSVVAAQTASVDEFYKGKTITIVIGFSAGGDYDLRARLLSRHMDRHIPGAPTILARNMPGAGGVSATNWLATLAPRDGTSWLMASQNTPLIQALGTPGVEFDARQFNWLGNTTNSPNLISVWAGRGVATIDDARKRVVAVGASGVGSGSYYYPYAANVVGKTRFKIVTGYPGGNDINIAMERGEVDGRGSNSFAAWKSTRPHWIAEGKLIHLVQIALKRHPELPDVPLLSDLATTDIDRQAMQLIAAETAMARAVAATADIPADRVAALRKAFTATMRDKEFLGEADRLGFDISPATGEEVQEIVNSIVNAPGPVVQRVKEILAPPSPAKP
ncbi:MAG: Bug family tripartite tricarboxylate transporter substrate binding protein [Beijerinckiaceae bacterium]